MCQKLIRVHILGPGEEMQFVLKLITRVSPKSVIFASRFLYAIACLHHEEDVML